MFLSRVMPPANIHSTAGPRGIVPRGPRPCSAQCAASYAARTSAATRPRSGTDQPFSRAQARISLGDGPEARDEPALPRPFAGCVDPAAT